MSQAKEGEYCPKCNSYRMVDLRDASPHEQMVIAALYELPDEALKTSGLYHFCTRCNYLQLWAADRRA